MEATDAPKKRRKRGSADVGWHGKRRDRKTRQPNAIIYSATTNRGSISNPPSNPGSTSNISTKKISTTSHIKKLLNKVAYNSSKCATKDEVILTLRNESKQLNDLRSEDKHKQSRLKGELLSAKACHLKATCTLSQCTACFSSFLSKKKEQTNSEKKKLQDEVKASQDEKNAVLVETKAKTEHALKVE